MKGAQFWRRTKTFAKRASSNHLSFQTPTTLSVFAPLCVYTVTPLSSIGVSGVFGVVCMCVCLRHVFSNLSACPRIHVCLFSPPAHTGFPDLCVCLAAAGQLINQIFKQCSSAQWVVPDYPWMLAVHGPATLHASSWTGIAT